MDRSGRSWGWGAVVPCVLLLGMFAGMSWTAAGTKSPVYDEPLHTVGGWLIRNAGDYRVDPDHPPLWLLWSSLPNGPATLRPDTGSPHWDRMLTNYWSCYLFSADTLYHTPGIDPDRVVARARFMMLLVAVALGALVASWSGALAGRLVAKASVPVAAVTALALFAFDPGLVGHASLVKNDIALAFVTALLAFAVWRLGERLSAGRVLLVALAFSAGFGVKFSALLFLPLLPLLLLARALLPWPWPLRPWPWPLPRGAAAVESRARRTLAAGAVTLLCLVAAWGSIWACAGFRFAPTPDPGRSLDIDALFRRMERNHEEAIRFAATGRPDGALPAPAPKWEPGLLLRSVRLAEARRLLPQAWLYGIVYTAEGMQRREGFLLGERRLGGWWYYLPLAFLFKAPLATLVALVATKGWALGRIRTWWRERRPGGDATPTRLERAPCLWAVACLVVPAAVFGLAALLSKVSLGVRHAFVLEPFLFVGAGLAAGHCYERWRRPTAIALFVLLAGLAAETLPAWPDEIAFFNLPSRAHRLRLLGDSNLDWGQDLPLLAAWQRTHPDENLYLAYFGQADPAHYGIRARRLPTSDPREPGTGLPAPGERATLAISATHLQGIYIWNPWLERFYEAARRQRPRAILGTIYLFDLQGGAEIVGDQR